MKKICLTTVLVTLFTTTLMAQQFDLSAEIRPRFEYKHGYKTLAPTNANSANFISQRTRLNFGYKNEKLKLFIAMQNVRVWGDVSTLSSDDNATALHEAWADVKLTDRVSLKLGRQEIVYDDHRIFGSLGWAQQARSHDAIIVKHNFNKNNKMDVGLALNSDSQSGEDKLYSNITGYKNFQYLWYHGNFNKLGLSFLLLNTGIEYDKDPLPTIENQVINYMQTLGSRLTYKSGKFSANTAVYFQTGKKINNKVNSSYFTGNIDYKISGDFSTGTGIEYLSGKDMNDNSSDIKSFSPLFGTNHKFNGWMDYFYVGNYGGSVGLIDIYFSLTYQKDKFSAKLIPHFFSSAANVYDDATKMNANLGTEIDFAVGYKIAKNITLSAGYSKMFATETMEVLKGGDKNENNNWGWIMFTFKPKLFSYTTK